MKRGILLWGAIGATLIGLAAGGGDAWARDTGSRHESWSWNGTLAAGRTLEINGVNGTIVAEPGPGDHVVVTAEKTGRRHDPALVKMVVQQDSNGIVICAVYPGKSSPCRHLGFGFDDRANDVEVDFHVTVPAGVSLTANNVNGEVRITGLTGKVKARTVNGACTIETAGSGQASTVNGAVRASIGRLGPNDELSFHTVNGSILTDFPISIHSGWGPKSASGTLGRGGARLNAHTVNGTIRLERQGAGSM